MATFIEMMKEYVEDSRARLAAAEEVHRTAAAKLLAASNDFAVWNNAYTLAIKEREKWQAETRETQPQLPMELPQAPSMTEESSHQNEEQHTASEISKTDRVREALRLHQVGITPGQLWLQVKDYEVSLPYLYSVLKRFRDNDEVTVRRGKYTIKPKPVPVEAVEVEGMTVQ